MGERQYSLSKSNKRIAKNTMFLYIRMIILTLINLYTSRVILRELGVSDFGTYSVVGGVIVVFSFLSGPLSSGCQRFISYELGRKDGERLKCVFSSSVFMLVIMATIIVLLGETIGFWFLNTQMVFPDGRILAANIVYQFSIATFVVNLLAVPYNASIIAHEQMSFFAYISIIEAVGKLAIALAIPFSPIDRLIFYAFLIFFLGFWVRLIYKEYCIRRFDETRIYRKCISWLIAKDMLQFSGWVVLGGIRQVCHTQGISIIVNMFFGVTVNAAQGIANQVNHVVSVFISNFLTAMNPQIVKLYANGQIDAMKTLVFRGSRFAVFMVSLFSIPIIIEAPSILRLWLGNYPPYTVIFIRAIVFTTLCESFATIIRTAMGATGDIRNYQVSLVVIGILHLPLTWVAYRLGCEPYWSMYIYIVLAIILQVVRIAFVSRILHIKQFDFYNQVIAKCIFYLVVASVIPYVLHLYLLGFRYSFVVVVFLSILISPLIFFIIGCNDIERDKVKCIIKNKIKKNG